MPDKEDVGLSRSWAVNKNSTHCVSESKSPNKLLSWCSSFQSRLVGCNKFHKLRHFDHIFTHKSDAVRVGASDNDFINQP